MKYPKEEVQKSTQYLKDLLKPGDTVYTLVTHASSSGMSRSIRVLIVRNNDICDITYDVSRVLGYRVDQKNGGVIVNGCGMDMGFSVVYNLGYRLFPDGFGIKGIRYDGFSNILPWSKESAKKLCDDGCKFRGSNGDTSGWDDDGGYALKQRWF